jgi:predicted ester cyclase
MRRPWGWLLLLLGGVVVGGGVAWVAAGEEAENEAVANETIARTMFLDGLNKEDWGLLRRYAAPTFVAFDLPPGFPQGVEGLKEDEVRLREAMPDLRFTIQDTIAEDDRVTVRWTACGRHTGTFRPFGGGDPARPTGEIVRWTGTRTFRIVDGKIVATWANIDVFGLLAQVGTIPVDLPRARACPRRSAPLVESEDEDAEQQRRRNKRIARAVFLKGLNAADWELVERLVAPGFVFHDAPPGFPRDLRGLRREEEILRGAIPNMRFTLDDVVAEDDMVAVRWTACGRHEGRLQPLGVRLPQRPPTGKRVRWTGTRVFRFADGKIAETWANIDVFALLAQLGTIAVPIPEPIACPG